MRSRLLVSVALIVGCGTSSPPSEVQPTPPPAATKPAATPTPAPPQPAASTTPASIVDVKVGYDHACALATSGEVWCWGGNRVGQLGEGTGRTRTRPRPVTGLRDAIAISLGETTSCAIRKSGAVVCWGELVHANVPTAIAGITDATQISVADGHACARRATGKVACWGANASGQLGDGTTTSRANAADVGGIADVVQVEAVDDALTCAVDSAHHASCWGNDRYDRLGRGAKTETCTNKRDVHPCAKTPSLLPFKDVVEVRSSSHNLCVRTGNGEVRCVGVGNSCARGASSDLADGDFGVPSVVPKLKATSLLSERCALDADHRLVCWGDWSLGGLGELPNKMCGPTRILQPETTGAVSIAMAPYFGCAVAADGKVQCWGANDDGALGDGTRTKHMTGAPVVGLFAPVPADGPTALDTLARPLADTVAAGFGEVWANAELLTPAGVSLGRLATAGDDQRGDVLHERYLVRIGAPNAGLVDIETLAPDHDTPSCGGSVFDEHYALRGKVKVGDLAPVVARDSVIQNADGTSITLGRGTDVEANEHGTSVFVEAAWRSLAVPTKDLGLSYAAPGLLNKTQLSSAAVDLDPAVALTVGTLSFDGRSRYGDVHADGGRWTVTVANDCVEMRAHADKDPTRRRGDGGATLGGGGGRTYAIATGARAYWPNGEPAGTCLWEWRTDDEPTRSGARLCFALRAGVTVCHDAADVKKL